MYVAKVVKLAVKPHPNANRLQLGYVQGIQVIVGLDTQDRETGVFFPCDGKLSQEFLNVNNLYTHSELNADTTIRGYFSDLGRVRVQKFRGERSDGFWCPLSYFEYTGFDLSKLKLGNEFSELNGHKICTKYFTPATRRAQKKAKKTQANYNLPRHFDTEQLQYNLDKIDVDDTIIITEKLHGASSRIGNVLVEHEIKLSWWQKLYNKLPLPKYPEVMQAYEFVVGTRNTIASTWVTGISREYYRLELAEPLRGQLKKGEVLYAEIVGFDSSGKLIMNAQNTKKLKHRYIPGVHNSKMIYTYGCAWNDVHKPQRRMFVYRITQVNADGFELDLSWNQVKARAIQLELEYVPEMTLFNGQIGLHKRVKGFGADVLMTIVEDAVCGNSTLDNSHIREGVCVRLEKANGSTKAYKHKSFLFKLLEGIAKENDNYVDTEEIN